MGEGHLHSKGLLDGRTHTDYMETYGFVLVRYAVGEKLLKEEEKVRQIWNTSPKEAIRNDIEAASRAATTQKSDYGRLQVHVQDDDILPGETELKALFPNNTDTQTTSHPGEPSRCTSATSALGSDSTGLDPSYQKASPQKSLLYPTGPRCRNAHI